MTIKHSRYVSGNDIKVTKYQLVANCGCPTSQVQS